MFASKGMFQPPPASSMPPPPHGRMPMQPNASAQDPAMMRRSYQDMAYQQQGWEEDTRTEYDDYQEGEWRACVQHERLEIDAVFSMQNITATLTTCRCQSTPVRAIRCATAARPTHNVACRSTRCRFRRTARWVVTQAMCRFRLIRRRRRLCVSAVIRRRCWLAAFVRRCCSNVADDE